MSIEQRYPLFRKENVPAYLAIGLAWVVTSLVISGILTILRLMAFAPAFLTAAVSVMSGMGLMFVTSALNLRRLRPGFRMLARGEKDPRIPAVWCPVLTAATRAAVELAERKNV